MQLSRRVAAPCCHFMAGSNLPKSVHINPGWYCLLMTTHGGDWWSIAVPVCWW